MDFELSGLQEAEQTVLLFWSTKESYFWFHTENIVPVGSLDAADPYAGMYHGLLQLDAQADDRRGTIEISSGEAVDVNAKSLLGLVVCHQLLARPEIALLAGVLVRSYSFHGGRAVEYFSEIRNIVEAMLRETHHL